MIDFDTTEREVEHSTKVQRLIPFIKDTIINFIIIVVEFSFEVIFPAIFMFLSFLSIAVWSVVILKFKEWFLIGIKPQEDTMIESVGLTIVILCVMWFILWVIAHKKVYSLSKKYINDGERNILCIIIYLGIIFPLVGIILGKIVYVALFAAELYIHGYY
jgi:hypothetical protein